MYNVQYSDVDTLLYSTVFVARYAHPALFTDSVYLLWIEDSSAKF